MNTSADFEELKDDVLASRGKYAPLARQGFKKWGRGVIVPATSRQNLGDTGGDTYWPIDMVYSVSYRTAVTELVETYNPTTAFVVLIATKDHKAGLIEVNLEGNDQ